MATNNKLGPGDPFPELKLSVYGTEGIVLPRDLDTMYTIVLFYRGHW